MKTLIVLVTIVKRLTGNCKLLLIFKNIYEKYILPVVSSRKLVWLPLQKLQLWTEQSILPIAE